MLTASGSNFRVPQVNFYRGMQSRHYHKHYGRDFRGHKSRHYRSYKGRHYYGHRPPRLRKHYRFRSFGLRSYSGHSKYKYDRYAGHKKRPYAGASLDNGWDLLAGDRAGDALHHFSAAAQANPASGLPKVGLAMAAADLGHLGRGVRAMRRAMRVDPDAIHYVDGQNGLRYKVEHLIQRYQGSDLYSAGDADAYFMLAALHYILDDLQASKKYAEQAGDGATSTRNLYRLIDRRVAGYRYNRFLMP